MPIHSINPSTGQLLRSFEPLSPQALNSKLALAAFAAARFPSEPLEQRSFWMRRLAHLLETEVEELATTITTEMGKTLVSARQEVLKCASACRFYADNAFRILTPETHATEHAESYVRFDPIGVILAVMPWNFPLWQVFRFLAPALVAGNVGLLKHAANVPQCALAIEALVRRAGFPRGVFQTLLLETEQVEIVLADERVAAITVTGSEAAGRAIAAQAGWLLKKTVLELGGSDPFIVLPSADLDAAITNAVKARCINNGQSCIAAKRFIVHDSLYTAFERRFTAGMQALRVGDPMLKTTDIGPLASERAVDLLRAQVHAAVDAGGRLLTGGNRLAGPGSYFEPTVIAGVPPSAVIARQETFGPLALLFRASSVDEAIVLANDTPFGLGASCWTHDADEQARLSRELDCGAVFFNAPVASDPRLPFGGIKHSGYGRELGTEGMREFLNAKTVVVAASSALSALAESAAVKPEPTPTPEPREIVAAPARQNAEQNQSAQPPVTSTEELAEPVLARLAHPNTRSEAPPAVVDLKAPALPELDARAKSPRPGAAPIAQPAFPQPVATKTQLPLQSRTAPPDALPDPAVSETQSKSQPITAAQPQPISTVQPHARSITPQSQPTPVKLQTTAAPQPEAASLIPQPAPLRHQSVAAPRSAAATPLAEVTLVQRGSRIAPLRPQLAELPEPALVQRHARIEPLRPQSAQVPEPALLQRHSPVEPLRAQANVPESPLLQRHARMEPLRSQPAEVPEPTLLQRGVRLEPLLKATAILEPITPTVDDDSEPLLFQSHFRAPRTFFRWRRTPKDSSASSPFLSITGN